MEPRSLGITCVVLIAATLDFCVVQGVSQYRVDSIGGVEVPDASGGLLPITGAEIPSRAWQVAWGALPLAIVFNLLLLLAAWPFARFYRQGPSEVAVFVGVSLGGGLGFLLSMPFWASLPGTCARVILFAGLAVLPLRPVSAP